MNKIRFTLKGLGAVMFIFAVTTLAQAQASRTWVSGVGDDVNPCSRTAPCKTFAGAISKTAAGGEISVLDPGGYGALTITKAITVDGGTGAGWGSTLASLTNGFVINANSASDVVTLRRISINGNGNGLTGIRILAAKHVSVEECQIFGFGNTAAGNGRGISDQRSVANSTLSVINTVVRNNAKNGIAILGPILASIDGVQVIRSTDASTAGIAGDAGAKITIKNSQSSESLGIGFFIGLSSEMNLENCVAVANNVGVQSGGGTMRVSNSVISHNTTGILGGVNVKTFQNNKVDGNPAGNAFTAGSQISQQ